MKTEENKCDVLWCEEKAVNGGNCWKETGYWMVCSDHSRAYRDGKAQPNMKQSAIYRESTRRADGVLSEHPIVVKPNQWNDIDEVKPERGIAVLVHVNTGFITVAYLKKEELAWQLFGDKDAFTSPDSYVTHWQPLPLPPTRSNTQITN